MKLSFSTPFCFAPLFSVLFFPSFCCHPPPPPPRLFGFVSSQLLCCAKNLYNIKTLERTPQIAKN